MVEMKYKEFWILKENLEKFNKPYSSNPKDHAEFVILFDIPICVDNTSEALNLIEYQALLDESDAHKATASVLQSEIEKLQKQNEKLRDIATRVSKQGCNPVNQYDCLACDATKILKEIEEE